MQIRNGFMQGCQRRFRDWNAFEQASCRRGSAREAPRKMSAMKRRSASNCPRYVLHGAIGARLAGAP
jgi:hypothetical protein